MNSKNITKIKRDEYLRLLEDLINDTKNNELKTKLINLQSDILSQKFGINFEKHLEDVVSFANDKIIILKEKKEREIITSISEKFNFIIEGDNYHSLKILNKTHANKIDVIYIDPPYNTGSKDWKYNNDYVDKNDAYRHSKWLSMMFERLTLAKPLLTDDGVLVIAIDENELATLILLLEEVFGISYKIDIVTIVHNPRGVQGDNFSYINEYALFIYKKGLKIVNEKPIKDEDINWSNLRNWGGESLRSDAKNCFYPIIVKDSKILGFGNVEDDNSHPTKNIKKEDGSVLIYPVDNLGIERKWRYARQSVESIINHLRVKNTKGIYDIEIGKNYGPVKTVWIDKKYDANEYGSRLVNKMVPENDFDFPKSLHNVYDCLSILIKNKKNAIILDFFAGSGTTGHAVLKINSEDDGDRNFILCTNNDVGEKKEKEFMALNNTNKIDHKSDNWLNYKDKYGIASSITYTRIKSAIKGYKDDRNSRDLLFESKINFEIVNENENLSKVLKELSSIKEKNAKRFDKFDSVVDSDSIKLYGIKKKDEQVKGLEGNLKYFKIDFIDKFSNEFSLYNKLIEEIDNLVTLKHHGKFNWTILNENNYIVNSLLLKKYVYLGNDFIINKNDLKILLDNKISVLRLPDAFYYDELKEIGEI
jgi:adenine-specific DNA-methyltransferase